MMNGDIREGNTGESCGKWWKILGLNHQTYWFDINGDRMKYITLPYFTYNQNLGMWEKMEF